MTTIALKRHAGVDTASLADALARSWTDLWHDWRPVPSPTDVRFETYSRRKPSGAWRVQFYDSLAPGMGGMHLDNHAGPYAKVLAADAVVAASHEVWEMLVDPYGRRFLQNGARAFLVEVCDPCETITDAAGLATWVKPDYYLTGDPVAKLDDGGYVSWIEGGMWKQAYRSGGSTHIVVLGPAEARTRAEKERLALPHRMIARGDA